MTKTAIEFLQALLPTRTAVSRIDDGIVSVLSAGEQGAPYDRRAATYDRLVRSRAYNGLLWSTRPADYSAFAEQAVKGAEGPLLEVGCGSAAFTAYAYRNTTRPCLLVDRSVAMLQRAASRLVDHRGALPENLALVQADLDELPFQPVQFDTVLFMGGLHLLQDPGATVQRLSEQCAPGCLLFMSGLVAETAVGRRYLRLLHRAGEVAPPRGEHELRDLVEAGLGRPVDGWRRRGSMVYAKAETL